MSEYLSDERVAELARPARPGELRQTDDAATACEVQANRKTFAAIDALHVRWDDPAQVRQMVLCRGCEMDWPCPTHLILHPDE